jgi:drug/metabolite transporter (DMT)-like permease
MAVTMAGVWVVARTVAAKEGDTAAPEYAPAVVRRTILLSLGAAAVYGASLTSADRAIEAYGPWQTILVVRLIGMLVVGSVVMLRREPVRLPRRSWPLLLSFALLDTLGHLLLYTGIARENGELAMVTSSAYVVITVILARVFLREPVSPRQWGGVVLVVGGIAVLAGFG